MFRHTLILIYRNFKRFKSTALINFVGLSTGLACTLLIYLWVNDELGIDRFHKNDNRLFQVMANHHLSQGIETWTATPDLLAETMADELPEIEYATAIINPEEWFGKFTLSTPNEKYKAIGQFAGKDFFNLFSYELIQGNKHQVLTQKNSMAISEELALKLFNTTNNVIGKAIEWQLQNWQGQHQITGVFKSTPANSSQQFDFIIPFEAFKDISLKMGRNLHWDNHGPSTYIVLKEGINEDRFNDKISGFIKSKYEDSDVTLFLAPYSENYLHGQYENGKSAGGRIIYIKLFSLIALFILVIACINFMNLSTAKASSRTKEIGVKKVVGAGRKALIYQYLGESISMTFISLLGAVLLVAVLLPQFNEITGKQLSLDFEIGIVLSFIGIGLFTGLVAGSYPALYLSAFNPALVLKGKSNKSVRELWARKGLVIFQFTLSVILIVSVLVIYRQIEFVQSQNLGYNKDNILYFEKEGNVAKDQEAFTRQLKNVPGIVNVSSISTSMTGSHATTFGIDWEGKNPDEDINFEQVDVDYDLIETMSMEMKEGRSFSRDYSTDTTKIIFNEAAIEAMGLINPIGAQVNVWGQDYEIIGVTRDFHFESFHEKVNPLFMFLRPQRTNLIMTRIEAGREREIIERFESIYEKFNPGYSLQYKFLDQAYQAQYQAEERIAALSKYFAGLAIVISCLGLFGLAAYTAERRMKEIGIRKILGSSYFGIISLLSRDFTTMVLIAIVIAMPISHRLSEGWLESFAYRIDLQWWFFLVPGLVALVIAWFTVGIQVLKAAATNPLLYLRDE